MNYEIKNTGTEPITLSNGNILAAGEIAALENAVVTVGEEVEVGLHHVMAELRAIKNWIMGEDAPAAAPVVPEPPPAPPPVDPQAPDLTERN